MAVDVYLFDAQKRLRQAIVWGISQLIHDERDYMLTAKIRTAYRAQPGEFLGFLCADGRFRLFEIEKAEEEDETGEATITATEAAVSRLAHSIAQEIRLTKKTAKQAAEAALEGSGFILGEVTTGEKKADVSEYYQTRWKVLREIETTYGVRAVPYYTFEDGKISGAYVDLMLKTYPDNGRIFTRETDASRIVVTRSGIPITRMYGLGKETGTEDIKDPPERLTIKGAAWSVANGDPIDKPKGQAYIEDPKAVAEYGEGREAVFEDKSIEDADELLKATYKEYKRRQRPLVSGTAQLSDMSSIPGYEHKAVEIYTTAHLRTGSGELLEAKIIDVQRNYLEPERTQAVFGEEDETRPQTPRKLTEQVAAAENATRRLSSSSAAAASRYIETKQLIQLNANTIQANAEDIYEINADVVDINGRLEAAYAEIESIISGETTIKNLNVQNIRFNGELLYKKPVTVDGTTHKLIAYGSGD